jgi:hypothetical protein
MKRALRAFLFFATAAALAAQTPAPQPANGLETAWDIAPVLQEMGAYASRLTAALDKIDPQAWLQKGASETYAAQLQSSREQAKALADGSKALAANPEKISSTIELLFRIQALDSMLGSLGEAMRKYQTPSDAQSLAALAAENGANRARFERYIVNLAAEREREFAVMDKEAQRCRGSLSQAPPARTAGRKK